ncbi:MAG: N-6 DNA methylase [Porphyromonas sp.]|uniref:N-6 DNA methylase n=1 Tax=Porphyromonas sp. TaxID=1924944 RepID=UPI001A625AC2|nr:N-6 DNA methylase [Porphyromonas sp.]MBL6452157.1 N-6 DNA methylase [Porphyromonas sp.]
MAYNKKAVLVANAEAIRVVLRLEKEHRMATEAEKRILRGYQGFGGLQCVLNRTDTPADIRYWSKSEQELFAPTQQLKQMIYREAVDAHTAKRYWESIKASVLTSFYTDRRIVSAISDALATSGVTLKRCLDPSSGMGAFAETFAKQTGIVDALEKDLLTARISQALHPYGEGNIFVRNEPFEAIALLEETEKYDLVTSNIPFGDFMVYDREYSRGNDLFKKESTRAIHNYFFVKGLDCTREGGLVAFITSQGVLDAALNEPIRRYLMQNSRLISAIRLPSGMFSEQAGTEVGSDLIVLQKQSGKEIGEGLEKQFVQTVAVPKGDGFTMAFNHNSLFEGSWDDVAPRTIATRRELGRDPYGKPTWKYRFEGTMEELAESLRIQLTQDVTARFDHKLYETGIAMSEEKRQVDLELAPEGVPALTLQHQYETDIRTDLEAPREMGGQMVYFDDDHHPVMDTTDVGLEQAGYLFVPEEYELWTQEVARVNREIKEVNKQQTASKPKQSSVKRPRARRSTKLSSIEQPSLFDFAEEEREVQPVTEVKKSFDASPRPFLSLPDSHLRDGSIVLQNGQVGYLSNLKRQPTFHPMDLPYERLTKLKAYIEIRESYHRLYDYEANNRCEDSEERIKLNRLYDDFVSRWGYLNQKSNTDLIKMDATGVEILFLERSDQGEYIKADIFDHPTAFATTEVTVAADPTEALVSSLNKYGSVELDYMSSLLPEMEESDIVSALEGRIYYNPEVDGYEVADKLISGNVIEKSEQIESWLLEHPDHEEAQQSLAALRAATPTAIPFAELDFNLGERWIPAKVYSAFASEFFETEITVTYQSTMDEYVLQCDRRNGNIWHKYAVQGEFRRYDGLNLLKHALHNTIPDINKNKEVRDLETGETKTIKVRDGHAIQMANAKIEEIRQGFVDWLGRTPESFKQQLSDRYNKLFNCFVRPNFDGAHQSFPDLNLKGLGISDLYKSQKDAVWMLKTNGGGICDHEVGAGKTLIMCTAAYEMKRLGLANKPMIIGLKANVFDIADTFRKAYPNARVLYPGKNDFNKQNRQRIFNDIKNNDWDCIILTHEQFGMIPQALEIQEVILQKEKDSIEENLEVLRQQGADISRAMLKGLEKRKQTLEAKLQGIQDSIAERKDDAVDFKMMGIDHLFVDESHQFKNLMFNTRHDRVSGLGNPEGSQRALNMLFAIRTIQERSGKDLGATFLSGTTISNSLTELYLLFKYLRPQALEKQGINSFDAWAAVFAKKSTDYEFSITNDIIQKERFRTFIKVPELAAFYAEVWE